MAGEDIQSGSTENVRRTLRELEAALKESATRGVPDEPGLSVGNPLRRALKRGEFRALRPISRRYDRVAGDLAGLAAALADRLATTEATLRRLEALAGPLGPASEAAAGGAASDEASGAEGPGDEASPLGPQVDDDYYWAFESRFRGTDQSIRERLAQYQDLAVELREGSGLERARWLDVGCGRGEFCELLRSWGFEVQGVDISPAAVEACRSAGFEATVGDALQFLHTYEGPPVLGVSAIQVVEHLPKHRWPSFFHGLRRVVAPGGAMLLETINPLNVDALASTFFADVTHTWPMHPQLGQLLAERAGFDRARILFMNEDVRGVAWDFAIWARSPAG